MLSFEEVALPRPLAHSLPLLSVAVHHSQFDIASIFDMTIALGGGLPGGGGGAGWEGGGVEAAVGGCAPAAGLLGGTAGFPPHPARIRTQKTQIRIEQKNRVLRICTS